MPKYKLFKFKMLPYLAKTLAQSLVGAFPVSLGLIISGEGTWQLFSKVNPVAFLGVTAFVLIILSVLASSFTFMSTKTKIIGTIIWFILFLIIGMAITFSLGFSFNILQIENPLESLLNEDNSTIVGTLLKFAILSAIAGGSSSGLFNLKKLKIGPRFGKKRKKAAS